MAGCAPASGHDFDQEVAMEQVLGMLAMAVCCGGGQAVLIWWLGR